MPPSEPLAPSPAIPPPLAADSAAVVSLESLLGFHLHRLSSGFAHLSEQDAQAVAGLSLAEYRVLVILVTQGSRGVVALCRLTALDKAWVSRTLARLATKNLVSAAAAPQDARRTMYSATAAGKRLGRRLIARSVARQQAFVQGLSAAEITTLVELLGRVQANVDAMTPRV